MKVFRALRGWTILVGCAVMLAACGDSDKKPKVDPRAPPAGSSAAFKDGFTAGCAVGVKDVHASGSSLNSGSRAGPRYGQELEFKSGWDQGYFACYRDEQDSGMF